MHHNIIVLVGLDRASAGAPFPVPDGQAQAECYSHKFREIDWRVLGSRGGSTQKPAFLRQGLFAKNGAVPLGDCFCCENGLPFVFKQKEKGFVWGTEQNRGI